MSPSPKVAGSGAGQFEAALVLCVREVGEVFEAWVGVYRWHRSRDWGGGAVLVRELVMVT